TLMAVDAVSIDPSGTSLASSTAEDPRISPDGRYVLFQSQAPVQNLVSGVTTAPGAPMDWNLFRRDMATGTTALVSVSAVDPHRPAEGGTDGDPIGYAMTADGRYVVFTSSAVDLVGPSARDNDGKVSVDSDNIPDPAFNVFTGTDFGSGLYLRDMTTGQT